MRAVALLNVSFAVTDLDQTERFATDFGLRTISNDGHTLFMSVDGAAPWCYRATRAETAEFLSLGLLVADRAELDEAVRDWGALPVRELGGPGGGHAVTLTSPEGTRFDLVHGVNPPPAELAPPEFLLRMNAPGARTRHSAPQKLSTLGPATLFRLGHVGYYVESYARMAEWLETALGLKCSDAVYAESEDNKVVGFFRVDRGEDWVDHHSIFLGQFGRPAGMHHVSFEVQDFEAQFRAHRWMKQRGWTPAYGVGRHSLGSHVFDMWRDPDQFRLETFSDTDLVNHDHVTGLHDYRTQDIDAWGTVEPAAYFT